MTGAAVSSTYDKALELNLDPAIYGTFAEIGAGQETANWFFRASGTAGMVAKTISVYDMTMSDAIYGRTARYVSRERLVAMLDREHSILQDRLGPQRGETTTFFSFCNTVRARGYRDTGDCHGWIGIRFQLRPREEPVDILLHVHLLDKEALDQMAALGVLGVNLIHAAFRHRNRLGRFVRSLVDNIAPGRIEIDLLRFGGGGFGFVDNRLCALELVAAGLAQAAMFRPDGEVVQAAEELYRRPVLLLRGSFDPVLRLHLDMLEQAGRVFGAGLPAGDAERLLELCEITMHNLLRSGGVDQVDFIDRADALQALGKTVLVSDSPEFHRIATVLRRHTDRPLGIILSIGLLNELFKEKWSDSLAGGILESFGRLFKTDLSLLVYPWRNRRTGELVTAANFRAPDHLAHLYSHFTGNGMIREIRCGDLDLLGMTGRAVRKLMAAGDDAWRRWVPAAALPAAERRLRGTAGGAAQASSS